MEAQPRRALGEVLLALGSLDETGLAAALAEQERSGRLLGEVVVSMGLVGSAEVSRAIAEQVRDPRDAFGAVSLAVPAVSRSAHPQVQAGAADPADGPGSSEPPTAQPSDELVPSVHLIHAGALALLLSRHLRRYQLVFRIDDPDMRQENGDAGLSPPS